MSEWEFTYVYNNVNNACLNATKPIGTVREPLLLSLVAVPSLLGQVNIFDQKKGQ